jgi:hypothetical protein
MQTFLPYRDFAKSARTLDDRRLGKQRVEALQVLRAITRPRYGWRHHPAVLMWRGYEEALARYGIEVCREWKRRGHADTCETKILDEARALGIDDVRTQSQLAAVGALPPWLGDRSFHRSHRCALARKDASYAARFADADPALPYVWPVRRS